MTQDAAALRGYFAADARIQWHCTNERFTVEEFLIANCEYPGDWDGEVERMERMGDLYVTVTRVYPRDRSQSFHVTSFLRVRDGKIAEMDEYWAAAGPPPAWRQARKIGKPIRCAQ